MSFTSSKSMNSALNNTFSLEKDIIKIYYEGAGICKERERGEFQEIFNFYLGGGSLKIY